MLLLLALVTQLVACNWLAPKRPAEPERRELLNRLRETVEQAGGSEVWVKGAPALPSGRAEEPVEAVVASAAYPAVISALRQQAEKTGLEFKLKEGRAREGWRSADIRLERRGARVSVWRLREVRRLRRVAIVIDDLGQELPAAQKLLTLPYPLTFSILPHLRYSAQTAEEVYRARREVMLHLPMEPGPNSHVSPGPGEIRTGMSGTELRGVLQADLASVPHAAGVNNHMGSRATAEPALMAAVMQALAERHLYFVDSRTGGSSIAFQVARRQGLPAFYRAVFLDDIESVPYTLGQLRIFRRAVEEQGAALAIGHPHPSTLAALAKFLPELERDDIQLVPVSVLVQLPEVAHLSPAIHMTP